MVVMFIVLFWLGCDGEPAPCTSFECQKTQTLDLLQQDFAAGLAALQAMEDQILRLAVIVALMERPEVVLSPQQAQQPGDRLEGGATRRQCQTRFAAAHLTEEMQADAKRGEGQP